MSNARHDPVLDVIIDLVCEEFGCDPAALDGSTVNRDACVPRLIALALCQEFLRHCHPGLMREHFNATPAFARYAVKTWLPSIAGPEARAQARRLREKVKAALESASL
jgi:hypothetical protein